MPRVWGTDATQIQPRDQRVQGARTPHLQEPPGLVTPFAILQISLPQNPPYTGVNYHDPLIYILLFPGYLYKGVILAF